MGRPPGEVHALILARLADGKPATAREIAHGLQMGTKLVCCALHRMRVRGYLVVVDRVRVAHMKRPATRYAVAPAGATREALEILTAWPRP